MKKVYAFDMNENQLHNLVKRINKAYANLGIAIDNNNDNEADYWSDRYENTLDNYSRNSKEYNWLEDLATDTRIFGWDCC